MDVQKWIEINNQTAGREKLARIIQYASRAIWATLESRDRNPAMTDGFKTLEYIFSSFRKLLRLGKCLDVFYASLRTIHYPDITIRVTLTLSKLSQALFLFADHIMWMARTGLFKNINTRYWIESANKYWLFSIIMNLCRDMYEIYRLIDLSKNARKSGISRGYSIPRSLSSTRQLGELALHSYSLFQCHKDVAVDTIKNVCDLFIPLTALGHTRLTPRTIGVLGTISSIAGLWALIDDRAKLTPI